MSSSVCRTPCRLLANCCRPWHSAGLVQLLVARTSLVPILLVVSPCRIASRLSGYVAAATAVQYCVVPVQVHGNEGQVLPIVVVRRADDRRHVPRSVNK